MAENALPEPVRELVDGHLRAVDRAAPGLVESLYLTGSLALGDYRHGVSDVDFLAVTARPLDGEDLVAVAAAHRDLPELPHLDGIYLDRSVLRDMPDSDDVVPHSVNGVFHTDQPCGELNPILWLGLTRHSIPVRGPAPGTLGLHVDPDRLRVWSLANLKGYWQPLAGQIREAVSGRADDAPAAGGGVAWAVLGPARLHYTLATGDVTSKTGAGNYAADRFPEWTDLVGRALAWRDGHGVAFATPDALAAAAMVDAVVDDAWRRWG